MRPDLFRKLSASVIVLASIGAICLLESKFLAFTLLFSSVMLCAVLACKLFQNSLGRADLNACLLLIWLLQLAVLATQYGLASLGNWQLGLPVFGLFLSLLLTPWLFSRKRRLSAQPLAIERSARLLACSASSFAELSEGILVRLQQPQLRAAWYGNEVATAYRPEFQRWQLPLCHLLVLVYWNWQTLTTSYLTLLPEVLALTLAGSQILALTADWQIQTPITTDAALYPIPPSHADQALQKVAESNRQIEYLVRQMERSQEMQLRGTQDLMAAIIQSIERSSSYRSPQTEQLEPLLKQQAYQLDSFTRYSQQQGRQIEVLLKSVKKIDHALSRLVPR